MFCIASQAVVSQCLAGLTGAIVTRQLATLPQMPVPSSGERLQEQQQPQKQQQQLQKQQNVGRQPYALGNGNDQGACRVPSTTPVFFAGVQLTSHQHPRSKQSAQSMQSTALVAPAAPPSSSILVQGDLSKHLLPLVAHAALQPALQPLPPATCMACLPGKPPATLALLHPMPDALASPPPRAHLQVQRQAPSALVATERSMRAVQLRLHAVSMQLEACPSPHKALQVQRQPGWGPPEAYEPPPTSPQLRLQPVLGPPGTYEPPSNALQLNHPCADPLPVEPYSPPPASLQLRVHTAPLPPEASPPPSKNLQLQPQVGATLPEACPPVPKELQLVARPRSRAIVPVRAAAGLEPPWHQLLPTVALPAAWGCALASADLTPASSAASAAGMLASVAVEPAGAQEPQAQHLAQALAPSPTVEATALAAAAAALPTRELLKGGAGPHQGYQHGSSGGDNDWEWASGGQGQGARGEEGTGGTEGQATGGTIHFMLLLAAAFAGMMGLQRWPHHRTPSQDAPLPPPDASPATRHQWVEEALPEAADVVHPLLQTMRDALEHLEARQAALELEVACLKRVRRPSQESIERKKELDDELRSLAILQSAVQQELRRLGG